MKQMVLIASVAALSSPAFAGIGLDLELGYESVSTQPPAYASSEGIGATNPDGYFANIVWQVIGTGGLYVGLQYADTEDKSKVFDFINYKVNKQRAAFDIGYTFSLNETTRLTAGLCYADIDWDLTIKDNANDLDIRFDGDGASLILGAETSVTDAVILGTRFSGGYETGAEVYASYDVFADLNFKVSYSHNRYEQDKLTVYDHGSIDVKDEFDTEFSDKTMRLSAVYAF